jgi:cytochrome c-type biogenesis protein CcmH
LYNPGAVQQRTPTVDLDNDEYIKELEKGLRCTCGCNLDIYTCRTTDFSCATSPALHREILALHNDGKTADEIREDFVARYGTEVLMSPKPEGFNLAGYLVPGSVMVLAGLLLTAHLLRKRRERVPVPVAEDGAGYGDSVAGIDASPEELERLRQELLREDI